MFVCNTVKKELMFSLKRFKYNKAKKEQKIIDIIMLRGKQWQIYWVELIKDMVNQYHSNKLKMLGCIMR